MSAGEETYGLICVPSDIRLRREAFGRQVEALQRLLEERPEDDALLRRGSDIWLSIEQPEV